jgi:hypothetical protein
VPASTILVAAVCLSSCRRHDTPAEIPFGKDIHAARR